uniref:Uncharacterized protein n=1 Tax=Arundo donax TaxID=35708 RepID=A0A0A9GDQ0_ARUDO
MAVDLLEIHGEQHEKESTHSWIFTMLVLLLIPRMVMFLFHLEDAWLFR